MGTKVVLNFWESGVWWDAPKFHMESLIKRHIFLKIFEEDYD